LGELADLVGGELHGDGDVVIGGIRGIQDAHEGDITFLANPRYAAHLADTEASAVIGPPEVECSLPSIRLKDPYLACLKVMEAFGHDFKPALPAGIHSTAVVDPQAEISDNASIGSQCAVGRGSKVGTGTTIMHGSYVGHDVEIGGECIIYPNVTIREGARIGDRVIIHPGAVIGADGFGFAPEGETHRKIPQIGRVVIEDDVEIGANTAIDRATFGETRICEGTKIDNLVQIAHNVVIGKNCAIAGQTGISGSTVIGDNVIVAGQVGMVGHIHIGDRSVVAAKSGVHNSLDPDSVVFGYIARDLGLARRMYTALAKLPELMKRVRNLEKKTDDK
jgi:UDP-3-O-[3-hydroxymyristoyl] glucosamine N-acyltransferase